MNGDRILIKLLILLWLIGIVGMGSSEAASDSAVAPIAVFLSDDEAIYSRMVASFRREVDLPVEVFNLQGDINRAAEHMQAILARKPVLLLALGAKAAFIAKVWTQDRPDINVLFALVLNWQRYQLISDQVNISGIAHEVSPGTQFAHLTLVSPTVRRIGVIYSRSHSAEIVAKAHEAAGLLGLELVTRSIRHPHEFRRAYKQISQHIDGFWILNDPVTFTLENMSWLERRCTLDQLVCIGQSESIAKLGVLIALEPDIAAIGAQCAAMAKLLLKRQTPTERIGVVSPIGTRLFLNMKTARRIGLPISETALTMANEIIEE